MRRLAFVLPAAFLLAACGGGGYGDSSNASKGAVVKTIQISEKEFSLTPGTVSVSKTGTYAFVATNNGTVPHALEIEGNGVEEKTGTISPGAKTMLVFRCSPKATRSSRGFFQAMPSSDSA